MSDQEFLCVGGPLDGQVVRWVGGHTMTIPIAGPDGEYREVRYRLEDVRVDWHDLEIRGVVLAIEGVPARRCAQALVEHQVGRRTTPPAGR